MIQFSESCFFNKYCIIFFVPSNFVLKLNKIYLTASSSASQHAMPRIRRKVGNGCVLMENGVS